MSSLTAFVIGVFLVVLLCLLFKLGASVDGGPLTNVYKNIFYL